MSLIRTIDYIHWRGYFVNQDVVRFCFFEGMNKILSSIICFTNINLDKYFSVAMRMLLSRNETRELNDYSLPYNWTCCAYACNNTIICQNERLIILINDQRQPKYAHHCQHTNNRVNAAKLQKVIKPLEKKSSEMKIHFHTCIFSLQRIKWLLY